MRTIYKYELKITDDQLIAVPSDVAPISVGEQGDRLILWALVDTDSPIQNYPIRIIGTGHQFPDADAFYHIGTVQMSNGLVVHVFGQVREVT